MELLVQANKRAQKNIKVSNAKSKKVVGGKDRLIPVGNLILLRDHHQDNNKYQIYVVSGHHDHKNAYFIKPLGSKTQPKQVNHREMFDLGVTEDQETELWKQEDENEEEDQD